MTSINFFDLFLLNLVQFKMIIVYQLDKLLLSHEEKICPVYACYQRIHLVNTNCGR